MFSLEEMLVRRLTRKTGFPVRAGAVSGNLFTGRFQVSNFEISNPDGFPVPEFLSVVEAEARIVPGSLLGRKIKVKNLEIHLRQLTGVRAHCGAVNIERFRHALERREPGKERGGSGGDKNVREIEFERLAVKVDHVATVDYASGGVGRREYPVSFEKEFLGVREWLRIAPFVVNHFDRAGLSPAADVIFATLLPDWLWGKIRAAMGADPGGSNA